MAPGYSGTTPQTDVNAMLARANQMIAESVGKEARALQLEATATSGSRQSMIATSLVNFQAIPAAALGDYVWLDTNGNGVQDAGENGIAGATVTLLDASGSPLAGVNPITTGINGFYKFDHLVPGTYSVQFVLPGGYVFTGRDQGSNDAKDSDASPTTGQTGTYTLASGQYNDTVDAGAYQPVSVGDFVWNDSKTDGIQDSGELGINGVTLTLTGTDGTGTAITPRTRPPQATAAICSTVCLREPTRSPSTPATSPPAALTTGPPRHTPGLRHGSGQQPQPHRYHPAFLPSADNDLTLDFGYYLAQPRINIVKLTNGTDNNSPTGPVVPVGSTVTFTYIVTNSGNVPLSNLSVTDDKGATPSTSPATPTTTACLISPRPGPTPPAPPPSPASTKTPAPSPATPVDEQGTDIPGHADRPTATSTTTSAPPPA